MSKSEKSEKSVKSTRARKSKSKSGKSIRKSRRAKKLKKAPRRRKSQSSEVSEKSKDASSKDASTELLETPVEPSTPEIDKSREPTPEQLAFAQQQQQFYQQQQQQQLLMQQQQAQLQLQQQAPTPTSIRAISTADEIGGPPMATTSATNLQTPTATSSLLNVGSVSQTNLHSNQPSTEVSKKESIKDTKEDTGNTIKSKKEEPDKSGGADSAATADTATNIGTEKKEPEIPSDDSDKNWCEKNLLLILTMLAVAFGALGGFALRNAQLGSSAIRFIGFPGEIFMNMLKAMVLPLIVASLISGLSSLDGKTSGKLGSRAFLYYSVTTVFAVILGIVLVMMIQPGVIIGEKIGRNTSTSIPPTVNGSMSATQTKINMGIPPGATLGPNGTYYLMNSKNVSAVEKFLDLFRNMFPANIVRSTFQQESTQIRVQYNSTTHDVIKQEPKLRMVNGMNVLGLIVFCIAIGIIIGRAGKPVKALADFFKALDIVITQMVIIIMWFGVVGIPCLIAHKILETKELWEVFRKMGMFMVTVIMGLGIHCFATLPLVYFLFTKKNPYNFLGGLGQAAMTAIGTSSSAACLPVTFRCLHELGVDSRVTKFVLPIGAMVNMDGTGLYEAVASIFIAQMNGLHMGVGQVVTVSITATLASVGAASIPSAGLVTMLMVLTALGLPADDISLILAVDWFLDRLRTAVNVIGDAYGCGIVDHLVQDDIDNLPLAAEESEADREEGGKDIPHSNIAYNINLDDLEMELRQRSLNTGINV